MKHLDDREKAKWGGKTLSEPSNKPDTTFCTQKNILTNFIATYKSISS